MDCAGMSRLDRFAHSGGGGKDPGAPSALYSPDRVQFAQEETADARSLAAQGDRRRRHVRRSWDLGRRPAARAAGRRRSARTRTRCSAACGGGASAPTGAAARLPWRGARRGRSSTTSGRPAAALWKTTDGGTTWSPVADKFLKTSSVGAVAVAESNPDVVYVGMGEIATARQHHPGRRRLQDDRRRQDLDARRAWPTRRPSRGSACIRRTRTSSTPRCSAIPTPPPTQRGVFRSRDGGKTWERVLFRDEKTGAVDLSMDPNNPDMLYAGLWEVYRTPHSLSSGGPGSGLFKSTDGGDHVDGADEEPRAARRAVGQGRRVGVAGRREAGLRDRRERERRRVRVRRWRRDVEAGERRAAPAPARVLLHAHLRRPEGARHGLRAEHRVLQVDRRAARPTERSGCRTATTTTCGSRRTTRSG